MGTKIDLTKQTFGRWTVLGESEERAKDGRVKWICQCSCENRTIKTISGTSLRQGTSQSCGCLQKERTSQANMGNTYGRSNTKDITKQKKGNLLPIKKLSTKDSSGSWEWLCLCDCGNECIASTRDLNAGRKTRCNECSQKAIYSKGEEKIIQLLQENNIEFIYQKSFDSCVSPTSNLKLKFDFYLPKQNYLIEFDGEQHFKLSPTSKWQSKCQTLHERDNFKNIWCKENNIPLIRIPYTRLQDMQIQDLLLSNSQYRVV